jgi:chromatin segregation and condensation protein Rec8/ScpA/Scc1 (kleisin family)
VNVVKEQQNYDKMVRNLLIGGSLLLGPFGAVAAYLISRTLYREVEKVDVEMPNEVRERLLRLPESGEAGQLLRKLEQMRTDVLHAWNAIEGVPKYRESFAVRLKRMNKQGTVPDEILRQILVVSRYRNRAVYESYHLQSDELEAVDKAFDTVGEWIRKVGYEY